MGYQEETVFPFLNKKMDFSNEQEQHKGVHAFLTKFLETIHEAQIDILKFDSASLKHLMEASKEVLVGCFDCFPALCNS